MASSAPDEDDLVVQLMDASLSGQKDIVLQLLDKHRVDVNTKDADGRTAIHFAAINGHLEIVEELCLRGANVNEETNYGRTAVHAAAMQGRRDTVDKLCAFGAKVNIKDRINDMTPLHWAAWEGHSDTVRVLVKRGARLFEKNGQGRTALELASSVGYKNIISFLKAEMDLTDNLLVLRSAQELRRLGLRSAIRKFPVELCRMLADLCKS